MARARRPVYTIIERGSNQNGFWFRIGSAFDNQDGSMTIMLNALPITDRIIIGAQYDEEKEEAPRETRAPARPPQNRVQTQTRGPAPNTRPQARTEQTYRQPPPKAQPVPEVNEEDPWDSPPEPPR